MPNLVEFFATWVFDPAATALLAAFALGYAYLLLRNHHNGGSWPVWRILAFYGLGLGGLAFTGFGFYARWQADLRWAFSTKTALLLFAIPLLIALGKPLELARAGLGAKGLGRFDRAMVSPIVRLFGNAIVAPLIGMFFFMLFLTPISGDMRQNTLIQAILTIILPIFGLLMVLPLTSGKHLTSEVAMAGEFVFAFAELMFDAIPGVVLSVNNFIFDGITTMAANRPAWFPSALDDQHFAGNLLWIIAEAADLPVLIMLFARWRRTDREIAKAVDNLSDEEFAALTQAHLHNKG